MTTVHCWEMRNAGEPLALARRTVDEIPEGRALVRVVGCGVCHTDLGYLYDGVRTRHALPLTLGHEISGVVQAAGAGAESLVGTSVIVPAVIPCGECALCNAGRGSICKAQIFPGNDVHGGFASHVVVPARGLCPVDNAALAASGLELADLSVLADAISTPYQAVHRAGVGAGDVAIFVGIGGVGGFGAQIARARGAFVIGLDVDDQRLARLTEHKGLAHSINVRDLKPKDVRRAIKEQVKAQGLADTGWKIFETSGTAAGQTMAFGLMTHGAYLGVVGFTMDTVQLRLSNLMAFDAIAQGTWGCLPELYPEALKLILSGDVKLAPFIERRPMSRINETFEDLHHKRMTLRPVLVPDFDS